MRVLKKAARIQRRQHTSTRRAEKGHSLEFVCWCTTERYSGYLAGDCEFETRFLRQPAPLEKPGPGDEAIGRVSSPPHLGRRRSFHREFEWEMRIAQGRGVGAEGVRYGVTAAHHNIARPSCSRVRHRSSAWAEAYRQNRQDAHARGRGMAQNRVAATHPARDRWFESIFLQR